MHGDAQQVCRFHSRRRQWPVEHPGVLLQRIGAIRRNPATAFGDRINFPVASEHSRYQRDRLAVPGAESQQCAAIAAPPVAPSIEAHAPGPYPGRIKNIHEADRSIRRPGARRNTEIDSFVAADDLKGIRQGRVLDPGNPVDGQVIDIEQPLPGSRFGRTAAGCPLAFEIRIISHREPAVKSFQVKGNRVKGGERRQQHTLPRQCFG